MKKNEESIISANDEFYLAFNNMDIEKMESVWSSKCEVSVVHPGWDLLTGLGEVMMSWRQILKNSSFKKVFCDNVWVNVIEQTANVICIEHLDDIELIATNIFVYENDQWKLIHHQAGPLNPEIDQYEDESMVH